MTAIGGLVGVSGRRVEAAVIDRMATTLQSYGQDSTDKRCHSDRGMFRCLLKTTPEDSFDSQPMIDSRSGLWMVFDGRLDNRDELARLLGIGKEALMHMSDSRLALHCVAVFGEQSVTRFEGDFAVACFDSSKALLWLARDPLGCRPLFWCAHNGLIGFATMPKALFCIPGSVKEIDREVLHDYICLLPMRGESSFFKDVSRVEPGSITRFQRGVKSTRKYHSFEIVGELRLNSDDEYLEAFAEHLERAVACRLRATSPIGCHLSSGLDSSSVAAIAAKQLARENESLFAFTAVPREGFDGKVPAGHHADEGPGAREVASRFPNIEHVQVHTRQGALQDGWGSDVERLDRAPLNACNMTWAKAIEEEAQNRGIRVLLTGRLGNHSMSYQGWEYLPSLLARGKVFTWWKESAEVLRQFPRFGRRRLLSRSVNPLLPKSIWRLKESLRGRLRDVGSYSALNIGNFPKSFSRRRASQFDWDCSYQPWLNGREMRIAALNRFDTGEYSVFTNACNVEMRSPAMDRRLIEFCLAIPEDQYFRCGRPGWLLERLMGSILPKSFFGLPTKGLQFADWYEQFDLAVPALRRNLEKLTSNPAAREILDLDGLVESLEGWESMEPGSLEQERIFRLRLLRGLSVGAFIRYTEPDNK